MPGRRDLSPVFLAALCVATVLGASQVAQACPSCQAALADGSQGNLAAGIYYSILFMMSMPFAIVGVFGSFAYRAVKREQRRIAEECRVAEKSAQLEDRGRSDSDFDAVD